jgi:hypothetical protein
MNPSVEDLPQLVRDFSPLLQRRKSFGIGAPRVYDLLRHARLARDFPQSRVMCAAPFTENFSKSCKTIFE